MPKNDNGLHTSELGIAIFAKGQHPRDLRKAGKTIDPTLKSAYEAWLKGQDKRTQRLGKSDPERAAEVFRSSLNALNPHDFYAHLGIIADSEEDESVAANVGTGISTGEKKHDDDRQAEKDEQEKRAAVRTEHEKQVETKKPSNR